MFKDLVKVAQDLMALVFKEDRTNSNDDILLKPKQFELGTGAPNEL